MSGDLILEILTEQLFRHLREKIAEQTVATAEDGRVAPIDVE